MKPYSLPYARIIFIFPDFRSNSFTVIVRMVIEKTVSCVYVRIALCKSVYPHTHMGSVNFFRDIHGLTLFNIFVFSVYAISVSSCGRRTSPDLSRNAQCHQQQQQQQQDLFSRIYGLNAPAPVAYHPGPTPSSPKHPLFLRNNSKSVENTPLYSLLAWDLSKDKTTKRIIRNCGRCKIEQIIQKMCRQLHVCKYT